MLQMKRREFLLGSVYSVVGLSGLSLLTTGCGSGGGSGGASANNLAPGERGQL